MSLKKTLLRISIMGVVTHPVVIAILTPYMVFAVNIDFNQWVVWAVGGMPISIVLNMAMTIFIPFTIPKVDKFVDKIIKESKK